MTTNSYLCRKSSLWKTWNSMKQEDDLTSTLKPVEFILSQSVSVWLKHFNDSTRSCEENQALNVVKIELLNSLVQRRLIAVRIRLTSSNVCLGVEFNLRISDISAGRLQTKCRSKSWSQTVDEKKWAASPRNICRLPQEIRRSTGTNYLRLTTLTPAVHNHWWPAVHNHQYIRLVKKSCTTT